MIYFLVGAVILFVMVVGIVIGFCLGAYIKHED